MATAPTEIKVTPEIAAEHGLTREEYARVRQILGREPNITELGIFSVMWSEHCSYKSSKVHLERLPTRGRSEEHTSELQSRLHLVCRLLLEKTKTTPQPAP